MIFPDRLLAIFAFSLFLNYPVYNVKKMFFWQPWLDSSFLKFFVSREKGGLK